MIICATALFLAAARAQPSPTSTVTTATTTATTANENIGTVTEFTAGSTIVLKTGSGEPVHYKLGKTVTYFNGKGKEVKAAKIKTDRKVKVHYVKEGNDMVVDKISIVRD